MSAQTSPVSVELEHAVGCSTKVSSLCVHPNNTDYVSVSGACVVISNLKDTHEQTFLRGHDQPLTCVQVSPQEGKLIASAQCGENADVVVWDFESRTMRYRFEEHSHGVVAVAFSDDDRLLATVGNSLDSQLIIWDLNTGYIVAKSKCVPTDVVAIAWGGHVKDIKRRATSHYLFATVGGDPGDLVLWDLDPATGALKPTVCNRGALKRQLTCVAFSSDGDFVYAGSKSGDIFVFRVRTNMFVNRINACSGGVCSLACPSEAKGAPQDKENDRRKQYHGGVGRGQTYEVFVGGGDGTVTLFRVDDAEKQQYSPAHRLEVRGAVQNLAISANQKILLVGTSQGNIYRSRLSDLDAQLLCENHSDEVTSAAFPPNCNELFVTCSADGHVCVWDSSTYAVVSRMHVSGRRPLCVAPTEEVILFTGWDDGNIRMFDGRNGEALNEFKDAHRGAVMCLVLSPNEKLLCSGGSSGDLRVWNVRAKQLLMNFTQHSQQINRIAFFGDGSHVLTCSRDRSMHQWDLKSEKSVASVRQPLGGLNAVAITPDQKLAVTVSQQPVLTFWRLGAQPNASIERTMEVKPAHVSEALCVAVSHDGTLCASGAADSSIKVWNIETCSLVANCVGHSAAVTDICFSPDNRQLLSVGADAAVFLWNVYR